MAEMRDGDQLSIGGGGVSDIVQRLASACRYRRQGINGRDVRECSVAFSGDPQSWCIGCQAAAEIARLREEIAVGREARPSGRMGGQ